MPLNFLLLNSIKTKVVVFGFECFKKTLSSAYKKYFEKKLGFNAKQ